MRATYVTFVVLESAEWLVYAALPSEGDGLTVDEICAQLEGMCVMRELEGLGCDVVDVDRGVVERALDRLCKVGLAVASSDGARYKRKAGNFLFGVRICEVCGAPFLARNKKRRFCSASCRVYYHRWRARKVSKKEMTDALAHVLSPCEYYMEFSERLARKYGYEYDENANSELDVLLYW